MAAKKRKKKKKGRPIFRIPFKYLFLLAVLLGGGGVLWWKMRFSIKGIDVSRHQGDIDWKKVADSGVQFAWIKATEGRSMKDTQFDSNWEGAKKVGVFRGAYHYFLPKVSVKEQVDNFLAVADFGKGDMPPALDLEEENGLNKAQIRDSSLKWLKMVEQRTGVKPVLYTMPKYAEAYLDKEFASYPLWMVRLHWFWTTPPAIWNDWTFWQYNHHGKLDGISEEVDLNYFHGSQAQLKEFLIRK